MVDKVLETIKENNMFNPYDKVIVAVSGGPDSICLLDILNCLKDQLNIEIEVAHVNHSLRGEEADEDENFVRKFCEKHQIRFYSRKADVQRLSEERGISCESAGREARYEYFSELMEKTGAKKVALAHNANDQAETILMRIMRGTGLEGLVGIKAVRSNIFVRPLINITREEIEKYCSDNKLVPRIDRTNFENIYARNKVRLELIPYIKENFNKDIVSTLNRLSAIINNDNEYLEIISNEKYKKYCDKKIYKVIINKGAFLEHEALLARIIRRAILDIKGNLYNYEKNHIDEIINLQKNTTGKRIMLPGGIQASNTYGDIHLLKEVVEKDNKYFNEREYKLKVQDCNLLKDENKKICIRVIGPEEKVNLKDNVNIKYFDYDKVKGDIYYRYRRTGDKFSPLGMEGSRKLKDIFIDLKIPQEERDRIPLICFGENIAWIVGQRISNKYKVDKNTKNILEIKIESEGKDEKGYSKDTN